MFPAEGADRAGRRFDRRVAGLGVGVPAPGPARVGLAPGRAREAGERDCHAAVIDEHARLTSGDGGLPIVRQVRGGEIGLSSAVHPAPGRSAPRATPSARHPRTEEDLPVVHTRPQRPSRAVPLARSIAGLTVVATIGAVAVLALLGGGPVFGQGGSGAAPGESAAGSPGSSATVQAGGDLAAGRALFLQTCAACHGVSGQGVSGNGPSLQGQGAAGAAYALYTGRMPLPENGVHVAPAEARAVAGPDPVAHRLRRPDRAGAHHTSRSTRRAPTSPRAASSSSTTAPRATARTRPGVRSAAGSSRRACTTRPPRPSVRRC